MIGSHPFSLHSVRHGPPITFGDRYLESELRDRGSNAAKVAVRALQRCFHLMDIGEASREPKLMEPEAGFAYDSYTGSRFDEKHLPDFRRHSLELAAVLEPFELAANWGVDGAAVAATLSRLDAARTCALRDALERARQLPDGISVAERLRRVGLLG